MTDSVLAQNTPHGRFYFHPKDNRSVPSITNIKDMKAIKGLPYWAARECAEYAADNLVKLATLERDEAFSLIKGAPWSASSKKNRSSNVGDVVHNWIDEYVKTGQQPDTSRYVNKYGEEKRAPTSAKQMWRQFGGFVQRYKPRWLMSEFTVWSDTHGYAGTGDLAAYIGELLILIDHKTGNKAYPDMAMQFGALANADFIIKPDGSQEELPHFDRFMILHLRPRSAEPIPVHHVDEWFQAFLGLKKVFDTVIECEETTLGVAPKIQVAA